MAPGTRNETVLSMSENTETPNTDEDKKDEEKTDESGQSETNTGGDAA